MVLDKDIPGKKHHNNGVRQGYTWTETQNRAMVATVDTLGREGENEGRN